MAEKIKILVTGADGQLGSELRSIADQYNFDFSFTDVNELDLTDLVAVQDFFTNGNYQYCINCAAYTNVDKAEEEPDQAFRINVHAVENLARACDANQVHLTHISTDFVFDGMTNSPYTENSETNPISIYGTSKLNGEINALGNCARTMVIRTSWLYSSFGNNFAKTMIRLGGERDELNVIFDQIGTPTYAYDLAKMILDIIEKGQTDPDTSSKMSGIFHYSNEGIASWYDFAYDIIDRMGLKAKVNPIRTESYPTPAKRPHFSVMDKEKIRSTFSLNIPHWKTSLDVCLEKIKSNA